MSEVEAAVEKLRRVIALSSSSSLHLLQVQAPRVLAEVLRAWEGAPRVVTLTADDMSDAARLTERVLGGLLADDATREPLLFDASAAWALDDRDAWTECLHQWNARRDRVLLTRRAPVVFAAPPWLTRRLSACAPDLWSVRGPSARVEAVPAPRIPWEDRSALLRSTTLVPTLGVGATREYEAIASRALTASPALSDARRRDAAVALHRAAVTHLDALEVRDALHDLDRAIEVFAGLYESEPVNEEYRTLLATALLTRGSLHGDREDHHAALGDLLSVEALAASAMQSSTLNFVELVAVASAAVRAVECRFFVEGAARALDALKVVLKNLGQPPFLAFSDLRTAAHATGMRLGVVAGDFDFSCLAAARAADASSELDLRAALAELHLDRGDDLRALRLTRSIDASGDGAARRFVVGLALIAHTAGDADLARELLLAARTAARPSDVLYERAEAALLATEITRSLGEADEEALWTESARVEFERLLRADPDAPRARRLATRWGALTTP